MYVYMQCLYTTLFKQYIRCVLLKDELPFFNALGFYLLKVKKQGCKAVCFAIIITR